MITTELTNEAYHAYPDTISKSGLDLINRSPAHYQYREQREPTRSMTLGSALHAAVLEPELFAKQYMLLREVTDRRASAYKEAVKVYGSEFVLTGKEADYIIGMQETIKAHPYAGSVLALAGRPELSVITKDPETGAGVRCRFDYLTDCGTPVDLKTTQDARPNEFSRSIANYNYHVQAAFYEDVWFWETGERLKRMEFIAVESAMPHAINVFRLDDEAYQEGRRIYREALNTYARCLDSGHWPAYGDEPQWLNLPAWAAPALLEEEIY